MLMLGRRQREGSSAVALPGRTASLLVTLPETQTENPTYPITVKVDHEGGECRASGASAIEQIAPAHGTNPGVKVAGPDGPPAA